MHNVQTATIPAVFSKLPEQEAIRWVEQHYPNGFLTEPTATEYKVVALPGLIICDDGVACIDYANVDDIDHFLVAINKEPNKYSKVLVAEKWLILEIEPDNNVCQRLDSEQLEKFFKCFDEFFDNFFNLAKSYCF